MQKKYAWTTLLTSEDYLQPVLNLQYSLRRVRSEYPLVIIVTDTIFMNVVSTLQANNCNFYVVPDLKRMHNENEVEEFIQLIKNDRKIPITLGFIF